MGLYKGIELDDGLDKVIRHMGSAEEYRETLQSLQGVWDNLTLLGQLSGTGTDMSATRQAFHFERMRRYIYEGGAAVFLGTTHIRGVTSMLEKNGFKVTQYIL